MKSEIPYIKYVIAALASGTVFVIIVAFYSNAGAASNDPFRFDVVKAVESLSFLFGWISGLPNMLALFFGCLILLLPSYIVFNWVIKKLEKMKNQISIFIWMVTILYMTIGCGEKNKTPILQGGTLENTSWTLAKFTGHTAEGLDITLNFEKERMHGKAVCNNYFSRYTVSDNTISFEPVGATRMMCENNGKQEIDYFNQFSKTNEFGVKNGKLILKNSLGILEFRKKDLIKKAPILEENTLGEVSLNKEYSVIEYGLRELFPKSNIQRNKVDLEDGTYDQITIVSDGDTINGVLFGQPGKLKSLEIISDEIIDEYGVQVGMSFAAVKTHRHNIKIKTDTHFHTYAYVEGSNIKYELCCNEIGPDKMNWSMEEIKDWKIKSLNWQKD